MVANGSGFKSTSVSTETNVEKRNEITKLDEPADGSNHLLGAVLFPTSSS